MNNSSSISLLNKLKTQLTSSSVQAALWTILGFGSGKVIQLLSNIILTRILFPEAFGLMVIVNVVLIGLTMFSDIGLKPAIVQHPRGHEISFLNTAWTIQIIRGFILFFIACALAWPAAQLYNQPILVGMICACATTTLIRGFNSIAMASAEREMALKHVTLIQISSQLVSVVITIGLAAAMQSVWSLVIGNILAAVLTCLLSHYFLTAHKHQMLWHNQSWQEMKAFGRWIMAGTFFTFIGGHGIKAIEAGLVDLQTVAFLQIATTMALSIREVVSALQSQVLFPKLSRIERETPALFKQTLHGFTSKLLFVPLLGYGLLSLLAGPIISLLYDERYLVSHQYLALYAVAGLMAVITSMYENALLAKGRSQDSFYITLTNASLQVIGVFMGFYLAGVIGMVCGSIFAGIGAYALAAYLAAKRHIWIIKVDALYVLCAIIISVISIYVNFPAIML